MITEFFSQGGQKMNVITHNLTAMNANRQLSISTDNKSEVAEKLYFSFFCMPDSATILRNLFTHGIKI